jgi:hypothetical protein
LSRFPLSTSIPLPTSIPSRPPFRQPASSGPKSWGSFAEIGMAIDLCSGLPNSTGPTPRPGTCRTSWQVETLPRRSPAQDKAGQGTRDGTNGAVSFPRPAITIGLSGRYGPCRRESAAVSGTCFCPGKPSDTIGRGRDCAPRSHRSL